MDDPDLLVRPVTARRSSKWPSWPIPDWLGGLTFQELCLLPFKPGLSARRLKRLIYAIACASARNGEGDVGWKVLFQIARSGEFPQSVRTRAAKAERILVQRTRSQVLIPL